MPMLYPLTLANDSLVWDFHIAPQAVVINLGTNDISNNKGDPGQAFQDAYVALLKTVRAHYPQTYIVCIIGPLLSGSDLQTIEGYIQGAVQTLNAAGDARVEFFDQIAPQATAAAACQYHPDAAEQMAMGTQLAGELQSKLGW
jgi:lysophospholipase L1-like esterase